MTVASAAPDHRPYYPGAHEIAIRLTGDHASRRLLGAQLAGHLQGQVPKRIDIAATQLPYHRGGRMRILKARLVLLQSRASSATPRIRPGF